MSARKKTNEQFEFHIPAHGGKRRGAGRIKRSVQANHVARPRIKSSDPLHVTLKLRDGLESLREEVVVRKAAEAFERAKSFGLKVIHFTLQSNHIHLLCEAESSGALTSGMRSLTVTLANVIHKISGVVGAVFADRYHLHVLKTPSETKNAINYILFNWAKHLRVARNVDPYSSIYEFAELAELVGEPEARQLRSELLRPPRWMYAVREKLSKPNSWLLRKGWRKARR